MRFLQLFFLGLVVAGCASLLLRESGRDNSFAADDRRNATSLERNGGLRQTSRSVQNHGALARKEPARVRKWTETGTRGMPGGGQAYKEMGKPYPAGLEGKKSPEWPCGTALLQGRRMSQEDRLVCVPNIQLQFLDDKQAHSISLLAVFDGHFGHDVSELAASSIYPRFLYHIHSVIGDLALTACMYDLDPCSEEITGSFGRTEGQPIHANRVKKCSCGEKITNISRTLLQERCQGREATTMKDVFPVTNAVGFPHTSKTIWHSALATSSEGLVEGLRVQGLNNEDLDGLRNWVATGKMESSLLRTILKEALKKVITEIDTVFSSEAEWKGLRAGSTACVVLYADEHLLVANLGDSKAFLCSSAASCSSDTHLGECQEDLRACRRRQMRQKSDQGAFVSPKKDTYLCAKELTSDHRPNRSDERRRVLVAGGFIEEDGGVPRVNGQLAVTRAIGDVALKRFGVIAQPEFTGWQRVAKNDSYVVVASDGVFEKLTVQDVCNVLSAVSSGIPISADIGDAMLDYKGQAIPLFPNEDLEMSVADDEIVTAEAISSAGSFKERQPPNFADYGSAHPNRLQLSSVAGSKQLEVHQRASHEQIHKHMAEAVVDAAFVLGSMDNIATVVMPMESLHQLSSDRLSRLPSRSMDQIRDVPEIASLVDVNGSSSTPAEQEVQEIIGKVTRQCYQLMKTLPRHAILPLYPVSATMGTGLHEEHIVVPQDATMQDTSVPTSKKASLVQQYQGRSKFELDVYREHLVCTSRQSELEQHNEVCLRPEGLSVYLSLIGSVPLDHLSLPASDRDSILGGCADSSALPPYMVHHHRYMLQQKFAKGGFGEIWLGVKRLCHAEAGELSSLNMFHPETSSCNNTFDAIWGDYGETGQYDNEETFVFKRILVEKGSKAYLSGYREKHFGEIFLNSSLALLTPSIQKRSQEGFHPLAVSRFSRKQRCCCDDGKPSVCQELSSPGYDVICGQGTHECMPDTVIDGLHSYHTELGDEGLRHIARYIEAIERPAQKELWLVFRNEGQSLSKLLYVTDAASSSSAGKSNSGGGFKVLKPSLWWKWLKTTEAGRKEMQNLLRQLLLAVHACHSRNITHRDIKPENMIVNATSLANQLSNREWPSNLTLRIIDFGSAIDPFTLRHLYDSSGPSQDEQTAEYAPPEALFGKHWLHFHANKAQVYDIWSVGVVMLELVLGTPHVFQISARTRALLDQRLEGWDPAAKETAYKLRAFMELCILPQGIPPHRHHRHRDRTINNLGDAQLASLECTEAAFGQHIKQRDPLGLGMPDLSALRLVRRLLEWYPEDRISAVDALHLPYFLDGDPGP